MEHITAALDQLKEPQTFQPPEGGCPYGCTDGYIVRNVEGSKTASRCKCLRDKIEAEKYTMLLRAGNVEAYRDMTFENYKPQNERQREAYKVMAQKHGSYFLVGPFGTGKTHLATATVIRAISDGLPAVKISVPALLKEMRKFGRDEGTDIERMAQHIPYLVLDDFGKQKDTDWTEERLFELLDKRYDLHRAGRGHTTITTNYLLDDLRGRMDGAILDRIKGMCRQFIVDGPSYRGKE